MIAISPSVSLGLGHLVRAACLKSLLGDSSVIAGAVDARLVSGGIATRRRALRREPLSPSTWVVDRGALPQAVIEQKLALPKTRVIWIRRALFHDHQGLEHAGFLRFTDLVVQPSEGVALPPDAFERLAAAQGRLRHVGVCHAYQVLPSAAPKSREPKVFLGLGAFEKQQRQRFVSVRRQLERSGLDYCWSAYGAAPLAAGFPFWRRVPVWRSLGAKAACSASFGEAGYNSVYEALYLGRPALFLANEGGNREAQRRRVRIAKSLSPLAFDAEDPDDAQAWLDQCLRAPAQHSQPAVVGQSHGLQEIAHAVQL